MLKKMGGITFVPPPAPPAPPEAPLPPCPPLPFFIEAKEKARKPRAAGYEGVFGQDCGPIIRLLEKGLLTGDALSLALKLIGGGSFSALSPMECAILDSLTPLAVTVLNAKLEPPKAIRKKPKKRILIDFDGTGLKDPKDLGKELGNLFANAYGGAKD